MTSPSARRSATSPSRTAPAAASRHSAATADYPHNPGVRLIARDLITLETQQERVILVGAPLKRAPDRHSAGEHLRELALLADTAGAAVVGELTQQLDRPHPATYLGSGKVDELAELVRRTDATIAVFDDELSPSQGKNLEDAIGRRVMDRAELILDIFATRARTSEAKMQVELAQLQYMLPRLTRMWTHLEKFRGGIGMRGPGETQLETDRRLINHRIKVLKERLREVQTGREVMRQGRANEFKASIVGYTNAGKSSVLRGLSGANEIYVEDRVFATLDPLTREVDAGDGMRALLTDTVGFIRKLPHHLVASFRATLEETKDADLLLHVIDGSHPAWEEHWAVVEQVLAELGASDQPTLLVVNKTDLIAEDRLLELQAQVRERVPDAIYVSAASPGGLEPLRRALQTAVHSRRPEAEIELPVSDGKLLAELHRGAEVIEQRVVEDRLVLRARVDEALAGRLRRGGARVTTRPNGPARPRRS